MHRCVASEIQVVLTTLVALLTCSSDALKAIGASFPTVLVLEMAGHLALPLAVLGVVYQTFPGASNTKTFLFKRIPAGMSSNSLRIQAAALHLPLSKVFCLSVSELPQCLWGPLLHHQPTPNNRHQTSLQIKSYFSSFSFMPRCCRDCKTICSTWTCS